MRKTMPFFNAHVKFKVTHARLPNSRLERATTQRKMVAFQTYIKLRNSHCLPQNFYISKEKCIINFPLCRLYAGISEKQVKP